MSNADDNGAQQPQPFKSDFSLFPIKRLGNPGWEYRVATWPPEVDQKVHDLFDGKITDPITYTRVRNFDKLQQTCTIVKDEAQDQFIMQPGDTYNFLIRRDSMDNKVVIHDITHDDYIEFDIGCFECDHGKRAYGIIECGHIPFCEQCSVKMDTRKDKVCPICGDPFALKLGKML